MLRVYICIGTHSCIRRVESVFWEKKEKKMFEMRDYWRGKEEKETFENERFAPPVSCHHDRGHPAPFICSMSWRWSNIPTFNCMWSLYDAILLELCNSITRSKGNTPTPPRKRHHTSYTGWVRVGRQRLCKRANFFVFLWARQPRCRFFSPCFFLRSSWLAVDLVSFARGGEP